MAPWCGQFSVLHIPSCVVCYGGPEDWSFWSTPAFSSLAWILLFLQQQFRYHPSQRPLLVMAHSHVHIIQSYSSLGPQDMFACLLFLCQTCCQWKDTQKVSPKWVWGLWLHLQQLPCGLSSLCGMELWVGTGAETAVEETWPVVAHKFRCLLSCFPSTPMFLWWFFKFFCIYWFIPVGAVMYHGACGSQRTIFLHWYFVWVPSLSV